MALMTQMHARACEPSKGASAIGWLGAYLP